ncbi:MAG TPA: FKBP-type peptidyl-prolyl cis-trans isomerase [Solirubrobacterales bacterium]|nr:FKBP-type peptidyl-prolyl cis-trans isomerase [Solirubrobacterales bacterium]
MQRAFLIIVACLALYAAGCGSSSSSTSSSSTAAEAQTSKEEGEATEAQPQGEPGPTVHVPNGPPPKKLETKELKQGTGATAKAGDKVSVQYVGVLYSNGKTFDSSWSRGEPFSFKLGAHEVITGWDKGIVGMKVGGRRELIIPPALAYGEEGVYPSIPPKSTLVFVVDLQKVQ